MLFLLKKISGALLMPLPVATCALVAAFICQFLLKKKKWAIFFFIGFVGLFFAQTTVFIPRLLLLPLENSYPVFSQPEKIELHIEKIVVLGGGQVVNPLIPASNQLNYSSLARVVEGVRLSRLYPEAALFFSGGKVFDDAPIAETMAAAARELGVDANRMVLETTTMDTESQARVISQRMGNASFILVTSASHMPRAMALFEKQGSQPTPAPCGHLIKRPGGGLSWSDFLPEAANIHMMERAIYEWLGLLWITLRGVI